MKIAIVSKADQTAGGASRVASDLTRELNDLGHEVVHFAAWADRHSKQDVNFVYGGSLCKRAIIQAGKVARRLGFVETIPFEAPSAVLKLRSFDIVHFHDTSSSFSPLTLLAASRFAKVVWTFHDCSPFTGGCIYPQMADCTRYVSGCGECPLNGEWPLDGYFDTTRSALRARRLLHSRGDLAYVAPSQWMADTALASGNVPRRPTVISNMIDTRTFAPPVDRHGLRRRLGLPHDRLVIALSSGNVSDPRKAIRSSLEAIREISDFGTRPMVVLIGKPDSRIGGHLEGIDFVSTGFVSDRDELAQWLSASDAFVTTSIADNQPLAIMEAMACGTPVYGWPVGGIREMISDGVNGRSIASMDPTELGTAIYRDHFSGSLLSMRAGTRDYAVTNYSSEQFAAGHEKLYTDILTGTSK
ncbi:glycosyltransferase [Pararhizobium sp. BT-229]|uniref:glycosyltransferase n=1 Tax=Pararhizobium sp. BT-229 TaxID=2986923 RepID=UPI0021F7C22F|nr:glycosyltransferase [Pararhizobium sp. BT-229]MCV9963906.1 glycosyltransferase [Pararhizobium sp. BT-229]